MTAGSTCSSAASTGSCRPPGPGDPRRCGPTPGTAAGSITTRGTARSSTSPQQAGVQNERYAAVRAALLLGAHRHRDHRHQRRVGQLAAPVQPATQGRLEDRHHDVVDGRACGVLDVLHRGQRQRPERDPAMRRDRPVEDRARRLGTRRLEHPLSRAAVVFRRALSRASRSSSSPVRRGRAGPTPSSPRAARRGSSRSSRRRRWSRPPS